MSKPLPAAWPPVRHRLTMTTSYSRQTRSTVAVYPIIGISTLNRPIESSRQARPERKTGFFSTVGWKKRTFNPDAFHLARVKTTAHLAKLGEENKTQEYGVFCVFITSSFQLKSLGMTKLLVRRRELFTSSLLCLCPRKNCGFTSSLPCLYMCNGSLTSKPRLTIKLDNLASSKQIRTYSYLSRILYLTLSLETYKESRQKRLAVKHREYKFKTAILHCFSIDTAANNARIYYFNSINLDSLNSRKHTTYVRLKRNRPSRRIRVTAVRRRKFPSGLLCLYDGFLSNKPRSTTKLDNLTSYEQIQTRTYAYLSCLNRSSRRVFARTYLFVRTLDNLTSNKQIRIYLQAKLLVRRKKFTSGLVTSNPRLTFKLERIWIILSLLWLTYLYVCHVLLLTLSLVEAYKESRQKRLVEHRKYNFKTAILQYFTDTEENTTRLHSLGVSLDSLISRKVTTYVLSNLAWPERNCERRTRRNIQKFNFTKKVTAEHGRIYLFVRTTASASVQATPISSIKTNSRNQPKISLHYHD